MRFRWPSRRGGTPTYLVADELSHLVALCRKDTLGVDPASTHGCIEASSDTLDADKVQTLIRWDSSGLGLGVQSFVEAERGVNRRFPFDSHRRHRLDRGGRGSRTSMSI
ncbi:MAG: hypothetical protein U0736_07435 [Gemmataceae bacterium]